MTVQHWHRNEGDEVRCLSDRQIGRLKTASIGVRTSSLAGTGLALGWIDLARCQHGLLDHGKARSIAGSARMLFDLLRHGVYSNPFQATLVGGPSHNTFRHEAQPAV